MTPSPKNGPQSTSTSSPQRAASALLDHAKPWVRRVIDRPLILAVPAAALIVIGLLALMTDHDGLAIAMILLIQAIGLAALLLTSRRNAADVRALTTRLDSSDARIIGDIARLRQVLAEQHTADQKDVR